MVEICWLIDASKCGDHGPGRTCKAPSTQRCYYKTEEAKRYLKPLHNDFKEDQK